MTWVLFTSDGREHRARRLPPEDRDGPFDVETATFRGGIALQVREERGGWYVLRTAWSRALDVAERALAGAPAVVPEPPPETPRASAESEARAFTDRVEALDREAPGALKKALAEAAVRVIELRAQRGLTAAQAQMLLRVREAGPGGLRLVSEPASAARVREVTLLQTLAPEGVYDDGDLTWRLRGGP